ncbi:MAG: putative transposase [Mycobacterium sp.]|jgi:hypothetical protein|nr:putative transposase [Mycobacterium sp.]
MIDEHTRLSMVHLVERSITAERLVTELEGVFIAAGGPPKVLCMDNNTELVSQALQQFCAGKVAPSHQLELSSRQTRRRAFRYASLTQPRLGASDQRR